MERIDIRYTAHKFEKVNLVTLSSKKGTYDLYKCSACGLEGKMYSIGIITVNKNKPCLRVAKKIKITRFTGHGDVFENLKPNTIHEIIKTPKGQTGVWVMGVGEPVKVLDHEFVFINE